MFLRIAWTSWNAARVLGTSMKHHGAGDAQIATGSIPFQLGHANPLQSSISWCKLGVATAWTRENPFDPTRLGGTRHETTPPRGQGSFLLADGVSMEV